mmetsp:Transcript_18744/g.52135  ORF Transcript_18744/g.52135 Transcript_18744/m.52135 type:complete len:219 (+) Transcript_18744:322-978(+)
MNSYPLLSSNCFMDSSFGGLCPSASMTKYPNWYVSKSMDSSTDSSAPSTSREKKSKYFTSGTLVARMVSNRLHLTTISSTILLFHHVFFQSVGDEFAESTCGAILNGHPMQVHLLVAHSGMHNGEVILAIFHELLEVERIRLDEHALPVQTHVEHVRIAEVDSIQRAHLNVAAAAETRKSLSKMLVLTELRFAHGAGWFLVAFEDAGVWRGGPRARRR